MDNRIDTTFARLAERRHKALMPYITAGYPDLDATAKLLVEMPKAGASVIELGFPYSDPIADGPVIQESFTRALAAGLLVGDIFETVRKVRQDVQAPIVAMLSFSIVYRIGVETFLTRAAEAGFDGLIVPDLSLEEAPDIAGQASAAGLRLVMLAAPTSSPDRFRRIAEISQGFVYYIAVAGTTGERDKLPDDLAENVRRLREIGGKPVCVGFGVSRPEHVRQVCQVADGAIVGSAIVRRVTEAVDGKATTSTLVDGVTDFVRQLATGLP
ncbi:MAG: tryptophan synthase subunit alpha [Phycisphaerae bacterium]|nr:tryptophan synthase subunit alpha [Phycisphaerae bacterium]